MGEKETDGECSERENSFFLGGGRGGGGRGERGGILG